MSFLVSSYCGLQVFTKYKFYATCGKSSNDKCVTVGETFPDSLIKKHMMKLLLNEVESGSNANKK